MKQHKQSNASMNGTPCSFMMKAEEYERLQQAIALYVNAKTRKKEEASS